MTATSKPERQLVFSDGSSNKFWNIVLDGSSHTVNFGRIGTAGQSQTKDFASDAEAKKSYDKLVAEKLKKGYADSGSASSGSDSAAAGATASKSETAAKEAPATPAAVAKTAKRKGKSADAVVSEAPAVAAETPVATTASKPSPAATSATDLDTTITREIHWPEKTWRLATFREFPVLEREAPREFDYAHCIKQLGKLRTTTYGWDVKWDDLDLPDTLTREEAHFWLVATTKSRNREKSLSDFAKELPSARHLGTIHPPEVRKLLEGANRGIVSEATLAAANLLTADEFFEMLLVDRATDKNSRGNAVWEVTQWRIALLRGFSDYVYPYLPQEQREKFRAKIRSSWDPTLESLDNYLALPMPFYLAAALAMHDEVREVVSPWPDSQFSDIYAQHYKKIELMLRGLGSADEVREHWLRFQVPVNSPEALTLAIACTDYSMLDYLAEQVCKETNKEQAEQKLEILAKVRAPENAEPMLLCKLQSKAPGVARDWLDANVKHAIAGLITTAGSRSKMADAAIEQFKLYKRQGYGPLIEAFLAVAESKEGAARVKAEVIDVEEKSFEPFTKANTPEWLAAALATVQIKKQAKLPSWASAPMLPPLIAGENRLSDEQVGTVLQALAATPVATRHPLFTALQEHISPATRDTFCWGLYQAWSGDGFPSKEKWAMGSIGHLGADRTVLRLTPLIRIWPGESQHARAVFGLECLRAIGSNTALMQLSGIAQKLKFKGLQGKAQQFVAEIAAEKGLTRDELEDRVVPDCGLDDKGRREFSFGPRSFSFVLGGDLKAMVRDEAGKLRPNLPDPSSKDDEAIAGESVAEWKLLKKQIKEVATIQASRLEQAMVTGRYWKPADFELLLVKHPLMTHLAQKLIWGAFDEKGKMLVTFRVTEERDYADVDDSGVKLDTAEAIGLVHPLQLSDAERGRWGEVLSDYEIVSPFPQLGRTVFALIADETKLDDLTRFHQLKVVAPTLVFTLEKLGWTRGVAMDGGCFDEHSKKFPAADITAVVGYEGSVGMGYIDPNEYLTINAVHFCQGMRAPSCYDWNTEKKLKLSQVPPVVLSEVIADLEVIRSKAK